MITAVITKKGRILQNKQINGADLTFTRVVASTANTPLDELQDKISVTSVAQTLSIQSITQNEKEQSYTILVLLENATLTKSYNLNQIGFYAKDPNDGEILFAIAQFDTPKTIEIPTVEPGYTLEMPFVFQNSNSANVTIDFDPDNLMSRAGVEAMLDNEEISGISSGNVIAIDNSAESPFLDFKLFGKSEQVTTTGKNFIDVSQMVTGTQLVLDGETITVNTPSASTAITTSKTLAELAPSLEVGNTYILTFRTTGTEKHIYLNGAGVLWGNNKELLITQEMIDSEVLLYASGVSTTAVITKMMVRLANIEDDTYEPYTNCKPAPSPDYPQEIESTGEDGVIPLNLQGKNLWTVTNPNENLTYDAATQIMTINGAVNLTVHELPIPIPKGTTVTISAEVISGKVTSSGDGGLAFGGYYKPEKGKATWQGYINIPACNVQDLTGQKYKQIFETTEEVTHFYAFVYASTASIHEPLKVKVQYEINNYATDFEHHKDPTQFVGIPTPNGLHGIPVASGGNYTDENGQQWICDEINLAKRKYIQRCEETVLDGETSVLSLRGEIDDTVYVITKDNNRYIPKSNLICDKLPMKNTIYSTAVEGIRVEGTENSFGIRFRIATARLNSVDVAGVKEFLTNNPMRVIAPLVEPIETDLTDEQIAALESLTTYDGATTILMDGIGNMEVQYFKDTDNGKAMGILKSEHIYLKKLIGDVNAVVKGLVG